MDTVGAQSWNGSLMETLIKIVFFHLHCGIAGNPKVQRLKMFCFSASLYGCVVYFCIIDTATDMFIFWFVIAKLSLLGLKDSQLFVNLSSSLCIHPFLTVAVSVLLIMPNLRGWVAQVAREEVFMRLLISSTVSVWNVQLNPIHSQGLVFSEPQETDLKETFLKGGKNLPCLNCAFVGEHHKSLKGFGFSMGKLPWHHQPFTDWSNILTKSYLFQVDETHEVQLRKPQSPGMQPHHTEPPFVTTTNRKRCARHVSAVNATRHLRFILQALEDTRTISRSFGW